MDNIDEDRAIRSLFEDTILTPLLHQPANYARLSALYNLLRGAMLAVDNNDRITAKAVLQNAADVALAMMENGK